MSGVLSRTAPVSSAGTPVSFMVRLARRRLLDELSRIRHGRLVIRDALGVVEFGEVPGSATIHIDVNDFEFYWRIATQGSVGAGDAYGDGLWSCDDLVGLVRLLVHNRALLDGMETGLARAGAVALRVWHALRRNTRGGSRRNIAAHYDLGNELFATFLSADMMYSAALWSHEDDTLERASMRKLEVICRKLGLQPGQRIVEIGTGWGGFALYAAKHYGCHVTTTTISHEQYAQARRRVAEEGLTDRVAVLLQDYRDLQGQYDHLVCIEMIEAVGAPFLETWFAKAASLLKPQGRALVQAITIEDHRYEQALAAVDFIKRYVFPGSFIPSINAMLAAKTRASDLALVHLEDFGPSYARTLEAWRARFLSHRHEVHRQGFDERFTRLWEFYLAYCEGGFREGSIGVAHLLFVRPGTR